GHLDQLLTSAPQECILRRMRKLLGLFVLLVLAAPTRADNVDDVVAKNIAARGGAARLHAIKNVRSTGKLVFGTGEGAVEADWATLTTHSGKSRSEVSLQGLTQIQGYDGKVGWNLSPFGGRRDAQRASADETKVLAQGADLEGPLVDYKAKGHRVELLGTEDVDGTPAIKLRLTRRDGDVEYIYLDPDSYLEVRTVAISKIRGAEQI